jgi:hypothetical protein
MAGADAGGQLAVKMGRRAVQHGRAPRCPALITPPLFKLCKARNSWTNERVRRSRGWRQGTAHRWPRSCPTLAPTTRIERRDRLVRGNARARDCGAARKRLAKSNLSAKPAKALSGGGAIVARQRIC